MRTDARRAAGVRPGQAMIELSIGLVALVLVVSSLCGFAVYISRSLKMQNLLRSSTPCPVGNRVPVDHALQEVVGHKYLYINEKVVMPPTHVDRLPLEL